MSFFLLSVSLIGLSLAATIPDDPTGSDTESRPDILLIIADDLGTEMLAPYGIGRDIPKTPNLDALAERSVLFRNAWSAPVCSPTRACIQTGRYGFRTGIGYTVKNLERFNGLSASEIILPEMLDSGTDSAYRHALFGKWHLNHVSSEDRSGALVGPDVVRAHGYGHHEGIIHNILEPDSYTNWPKVSNGEQRQSRVYATTATVDDFLKWRETVDAPYFAVLAFNAPHTPLHAPPRELHSVDLTSMGSPNQRPRVFYKAMVEALDTEIGRLFESMGSSLSETTVIFMGDNGTPIAVVKKDPYKTLDKSHSKGSVYEGGVNVPLYVSGPGVTAAGAKCNAMVHAVDIFATVAELADVDLSDPDVYPADRTLDSKSFVPYLTDPELPSPRRFNFTEKFFENTAVAAQVDKTQVGQDIVCQEVVESTGSDDGLSLSMCGDPIGERMRGSSTLTLTGAAPNAQIFILGGPFRPRPDPRFGGAITICPNTYNKFNTIGGTLDLNDALTADGEGNLSIPGIIRQTSNPSDYYLQAATLDEATATWSISNAIRVNQTVNAKAVISEAGYKLISYVSGGHSEFYHLPSDPRERVDLLANGTEDLSDDDREKLAELRKALFDLLRTWR